MMPQSIIDFDVTTTNMASPGEEAPSSLKTPDNSYKKKRKLLYATEKPNLLSINHGAPKISGCPPVNTYSGSSYKRGSVGGVFFFFFFHGEQSTKPHIAAQQGDHQNSGWLP